MPHAHANTFGSIRINGPGVHYGPSYLSEGFHKSLSTSHSTLCLILFSFRRSRLQCIHGSFFLYHFCC